ncbi:MAG TPA: ABC-2 family transporter protein [Verrucomicrobiae bacterium]|nr:ABC-2 family transporter protein [Verrucomicrobiae bacterium]
MLLRRYASIYSALWKNGVAREMAFKVNFLLWIVVDLLWFALQICFFSVLYSHTDKIGDWSKWEVILLAGAGNFIQQIFVALFQTNMVHLSEQVRTGRLDFLLLLPVNTRFIVSLRQPDLNAYVTGALAVAVMVYAGVRLNLSPSPAAIAGFLVLCAAGVLIHYSMMFMLSCACFWTVRAEGIVWGYYHLLQVSRQPDSAFSGAFRIFFTFVIPMILVANVPAKLLAKKIESPVEMLLLLGMSGVIFLGSEAFWRFSMKRYRSASS